jgi:putative ABC transport system permease protein
VATGSSLDPAPSDVRTPVRLPTPLPGAPAPRAVLRDGLRTVIAQPLPSAVAALVVAISCFVVLATTGQSVAAEQAVLSRIDSAGAKLVTAFDASGEARVHASSVPALSTRPEVDWVIGLGPVRDVRNADAPAHGGAGVALRTLVGTLPTDIPIVAGRAPRAGEVLVGVEAARSLGLADGVGNVTDGVQAWPVVGVFESRGPLDTLDSAALVTPGAGETKAGDVRYVYAMASSVSHVKDLERVIPALIHAEEAAAVTIESPTGAIALRRVVEGEMGDSARRIMVVVLAVGLVTISATMFGAVSSRRRDFGRRRALGATRSAIVVLVIVQSFTAAALGVLVGIGAATLFARLTASDLPDVSFTLGLAGLAMTTALVGAIPPAIVASRRDPVRVLRVP